MTVQMSPGMIEALPFVDTTPDRRVSTSDISLAPCVALVGCDGSGKSTLARDLTALLNAVSPAQSIYLGLGTGDLGRSIGRLPLIGALLERFLTAKASKAHSGTEKRLPGLVTALVMFAFSLARWRRFGHVIALRQHGICVVSDRYPQAELAGRFDGPGLNWTRRGSALVERLATRERHLYEQMAAYRPTLVVRLNVDADTAMARKPDHRRELLDAKLAIVPTLKFGGARIVDVDATRPYAEVRAAVYALMQIEGLIPSGALVQGEALAA